jgi:E3 ubiquitin-protein ligase UBR4
VLSYIRTNDKAINEGCEKILAQYQDELLPVESFDEFCDVMGLLSVIQQPSAFLKELVTSVAASV